MLPLAGPPEQQAHAPPFPNKAGNGQLYTAFFPPLVPLPAAVQAATRLAEVDVLLPCMSAFWDCCYFYTPISHRPSFEDAFANPGPSPIFGPRKPIALLYAMAAIGLRYVRPSALALSEIERTHLGEVLCTRAKAMLLSDYFAGSPSSGTRVMTSIEALSTIKFLVNNALAEGRAEESATLVERGCDILSDLLPAVQKEPNDAIDWLSRELVLRNAIEFAAFDFSRAVLSGINPRLWCLLKGPLPLPVHQTLFEMPAEEAFSLLRWKPSAQMDWSPLTEWPMNEWKVQHVVREAASPMFDGRASIWCCWHVLSAMMFVRSRLKLFAKDRELDVLAIAGQPPEADTADEAEYRRGATIAHDMVSTFYSTMPVEIGTELGQGNTVPLYLQCQHYTGRAEYFFAVLGACMGLESGRMATWIWAPPQEPLDERYLGSPPFCAAMESSVVVAKLANAQLQADRKLRISHYAPLGDVVRFLGFQFTVIKMMRARSCGLGHEIEAIRGVEHDIESLVRYANALTAIYTTIGKTLNPWLEKSLEQAELSEEAKMAAELIELSRATTKSSEFSAGSDHVSSKSRTGPSFAAGVLDAEELLRSWIITGTPAAPQVGNPNKLFVDGEMLIANS